MNCGSDGHRRQRGVVKSLVFSFLAFFLLTLFGCGGSGGGDNSRTTEGGTGGTGLEFFGRVIVDAARSFRTDATSSLFTVTIEQTGEQTIADSNGFFSLPSSILRPTGEILDIRFSNNGFDGVASLPLGMASQPNNVIAVELEVSFAKSTGNLEVERVEIFQRGEEESVKSSKAEQKKAKKQKDETLETIDAIEDASKPTNGNGGDKEQPNRETPPQEEQPGGSSADTAANTTEEEDIKEEIDSSDFL